jgi:MOSC domain-containing protein YiiM
MFQGRLVGIYLTEQKREDLRQVDQVRAVAGQGLQGDRYFQKPAAGPDREVTLIESEALEALAKECEIGLSPGQARRNLVTQGVPLNHLVGRDFTIGEVLLHGHRLCEPCGHLEELTRKGVREGLCHRGGLRAQVVRGGILRKGDVIQPEAVAG